MNETKKYYVAKSSEWKNKLSVVDHLRFIWQFLELERNSIIPSIEKTVQEMLVTLVSDSFSFFLQAPLNGGPSSLDWMLDNEHIEGLKLMYMLFKLVPNGHSEMKKFLTCYVKSVGVNIEKDISNEISK